MYRKSLEQKSSLPNWLVCFNHHGLLVAATRYFMGRMTIRTTCFARELATAWPELPEHTRITIQRELDEAFLRDDEARKRGDDYRPLGHDCDREAWEEVRRAYQASQREPVVIDPAKRVIPDRPERLAYSIAEAAKLLGLHYASVYRLIQRRKLRTCRVLPGKILISRKELVKFLETESMA